MFEILITDSAQKRAFITYVFGWVATSNIERVPWGMRVLGNLQTMESATQNPLNVYKVDKIHSKVEIPYSNPAPFLLWN